MTEPGAASFHYFLDWRPVGAAPLQGVISRRSVKASGLVIPAGLLKDKPAPLFHQRRLIQAITELEVIERSDGLFLMRIGFAEPPATTGADTAGGSIHLDEVATLVSMKVKELLGHHHAFHSTLPKHDMISAPLSDEVFRLAPVYLHDEEGAAAFAAPELTDEILKGLRSKPFQGEPRTNRLALQHLRYQFINAYNAVSLRINMIRTEQLRIRARLKPRPTAACFLIIIAATYGVLAIRHGTAVPSSLVLVLMAGLFGYVGMYLAADILLYDRGRIRLLRSAAGYYNFANPLNFLIARIFASGPTTEPLKLHGFESIIAGFSVWAEGETHRFNVKQIALSFSFALFTGLLAISANLAVAEKAAAKMDLLLDRLSPPERQVQSPAAGDQGRRAAEDAVDAVPRQPGGAGQHADVAGR